MVTATVPSSNKQRPDQTTPKILTGTRLHLTRAIWVIYFLVLVAFSLVAGIWFAQYLNSGTANVSAAWNADSTFLLLSPQDDATRALIADGDLLLSVDGQAIPPRINHTQSLSYPIYGPLNGQISAVVQTPGQPPRQITLALNRVTDSNLRWLDSLNLPADIARTLWLLVELAWVLNFWALAFFIALKRSDERIALITGAAFLGMGIRFSALEVIRFLPGYEAPLLLGVGIFNIISLWALVLYPNGYIYPRIPTLLFLFFYVFHVINRFTAWVPILKQMYLFVDLASFLFALLLQAYRYANIYNHVQRQQGKWGLIGIMIGIFGYFTSLIASYGLGGVEGLPGFLLALMGRVSIVCVFFGIAIGMLRFRLYDADLVLNRTLVYGGATLFLGSCFFALVLLLQRVLSSSNLSGIVTAVAAVAVGLAFQPTRNRLQRFIDRRFFRLRLDLNQLSEKKQKRRTETGKPPSGVLSGKTMNGIRIEGLLNRGGMGSVYLGRRGTQQVAIKFVADASNPSDQALFEREIEIMRGLAHPNIVHLVESGKVGNSAYIAMEYVAGQPLDEYLEEQGKLPLDQVRLILGDIASALDYIHARGVVHRDIKPANIILQEMRAVLIDFGLAYNVGGSSHSSDSGLIGTLEYLAPEQITSAEHVDGRADVYAMGAITYHLLTGEMPFKGSVPQLVFAHLNQPPPDLLTRAPELSPAASFAVLRALSKRPEERFASVGEFVTALGA
jgi:predicted Ser/Thr protein kinase